MKKELRGEVFDKCNGRCAYCGVELPAQGWHVDHVISQSQYSERHGALIVDGRLFTDYGVDDIQNLLPACRRCNLWKKTFSIDQFRSEIEAQADRLSQYSAQFRLAHDFGVVSNTREPVKFYFEN